MATFTVTTATNWQDAAYSSRAGNDTYTINGGSVTIDTDTRYCTNATVSTGNFGKLTLSATLGGSVTIDGTKVRIIPYSSGSGTVPAIGTTISKGGVSAYLLGVWSALNTAPTAAGGSMPASGWIKVKNVTGGSFSSGALTGITATATGADVVGWIEVIGCEGTGAATATGIVTCVRLGTFTVTGAWFAAGTTNGSSGQTMQLPASLANTYYAGVYMETSPGNATYEFWPSAGTKTGIGQDGYRGKVVWISSQGLVTIGNNGSTTDGYTPISGLAVVVPNVNLLCCTSGSESTNDLPNATLKYRYTFATTGGGVLNIDKCNINWYVDIVQPYSIALTNSCVTDNITIDEISQPISWSLVGVGQSAALAQFALISTLNFAGGTLTNCVWTTSTLANAQYAWSITDTSGFTFNNNKLIGLSAKSGAAAGAATALRMANCTFNNQLHIGGQFLMTTCNELDFENTYYIDTISGPTIATDPIYVWTMASNTLNVTMNGLNFPIPQTQPYSGILSIAAAGCSNIKLRNLGTYLSPLDLGGPRVDDVAWTRSGTTVTVTSTAHGLTTGQIIIPIIASNTAAITIAAKTITVTDANTFTFTGVGSGTTSGTVSYYLAVCANLFVLAGSGAANPVYIQRCYTPHTRTNLFTTDNSNKNIYMDDVISDFANAPLFAQLNGTFRGCSGTPLLTAQTAVYGTHWLDYYEYGVPANTSGQSWSHSSTTATITAVGHNMRTNTIISVTTTSDTSAVPLGQYTVTVLTSSTFTITVPAAGGTSGTLSFTVCTGAVSLLMNEASADTTGLYTIDSGTPSFTSAGSLYMPTVGEQITFETPTYILGHASFPNVLPVMAGGTISNYNIYYAIDKNDGNGYGSFQNLYYIRTGGGGTSGTNHVTMTNTTGVQVNDYVTGTNIAGGANVVSVDSSTQITVSINNIGTVSGTLIFRHAPYESGINTALGFKMKWRIYTLTTNATAITSLILYTTSVDSDREIQYPLDLVPIVITIQDIFGNPIENARVALFQSSNSTELFNILTDINGLVSTTVSYLSDTDVYIRVRKSSPGDTRYINNNAVGTITSSGLSITITMTVDPDVNSYD